MRAIAVRDRDAGVGGLTLTDMPYPRAAENDVIVRVHAASFTPGELDWPGTWSDRASRDRAPSIPGHELSGTVVELGYGTIGLTVGQRVFGLTDWTRNGSLAEYTAVEARNLAPLAADIDHTVAALPISGLTAWQGLFDHATSRPAGPSRQDDHSGRGRTRSAALLMSVRIASGVLIASTAAAVVGCASATERPTTLAPTAAASEHPSETRTSLIHQALPNIQGETLTSATVTLPPAARAVPTDTATRSSTPTCSKALCAASSKANRCAHTTKARTGSSSQEPTTWPPKTPATPAELLVVFVVVALRDHPRTVVTDPHASYVGTELGERTVLPGANAILGEIRYSNRPG
jgi:hypothetical protein